MKSYVTIREAAAYLGLPERILRVRLINRKLPGFYAGSRFYVNLSMLIEMLQTECEYYSGGKAELPTTPAIKHNRPRMSGIEYGARIGILESWEIEAETSDRDAEFATELRTKWDRGYFT